jgi:hypothetical protein
VKLVFCPLCFLFAMSIKSSEAVSITAYISLRVLLLLEASDLNNCIFGMIAFPVK